MLHQQLQVGLIVITIIGALAAAVAAVIRSIAIAVRDCGRLPGGPKK